MKKTLCAIILVLPLLSTPTMAQFYTIEGGALTEGCLPPCLCALFLLGEPSGSFALIQTGVDGDFTVYDTVDVLVTVPTGSGVIELVGAGVYRVDPASNLHEWILDLTDIVTGDTYAMATDGVVPINDGNEFPVIDAYLATDFACFGTQLQLVAQPSGAIPQPSFIRGDCNGDAGFDVADAVEKLNLLFVSGSTDCANACDANDDNTFDISDAIFTLTALFVMGPDPDPPFPGCGVDGTTGSLDCSVSAACP